MATEPPPHRLLFWIIAALACWGVILAAGAYLGLDAQTPSHDYRRLLVVAAIIGGMVVFWLAAIWRRARRK